MMVTFQGVIDHKIFSFRLQDSRWTSTTPRLSAGLSVGRKTRISPIYLRDDVLLIAQVCSFENQKCCRNPSRIPMIGQRTATRSCGSVLPHFTWRTIWWQLPVRPSADRQVMIFRSLPLQFKVEKKAFYYSLWLSVLLSDLIITVLRKLPTHTYMHIVVWFWYITFRRTQI